MNLECPENGWNIKERINEKTINNIKSWEECSLQCSERTDCKYWVWHRESAGAWAYQCVTMTDGGFINKDRNTISGIAGCMEKEGELPFELFSHDNLRNSSVCLTVVSL